MSGLESTDKNYTDDTTDGGTASINDAPPTSFSATKEAIKALDAKLAAWEAKLEGFDASMAGLATDNAMMEDRDAHFAEWVDANKTQLRKCKEVRDAFVQQVKDRETGARQMKDCWNEIFDRLSMLAKAFAANSVRPDLIFVNEAIDNVKESLQRAKDLRQSLDLGDSGSYPEGSEDAEFFRKLLIVFNMDKE